MVLIIKSSIVTFFVFFTSYVSANEGEHIQLILVDLHG